MTLLQHKIIVKIIQTNRNMIQLLIDWYTCTSEPEIFYYKDSDSTHVDEDRVPMCYVHALTITTNNKMLNSSATN